MSRKRKPVLQLGSSNSKLHKYGYSKEFHAAEKKGKTALPMLVGNYSDSEDDETPNEGDEQASRALEPVTDGPEALVHQDSNHGNPSTREHANKSPDIDDELKNFLSEIEAIPMPPADGGGDQESKGEQRKEHLDEPKGNTDLSPKEPIMESASDGIQEPSEDPSHDKEAGASSSKPKSRYSMFVKGESEFVHSPTSQEREASTTKADVSDTRGAEEEIPEEPTSCWQLVQDEGSQYYYYWNTLTNEVTWEIPSEYTQFLLLHREFTEKLARLPAHVLKAHEEKKAKEAEAFTAASVPATESAAKNDAHRAEQTTVHGSTTLTSPTPSTKAIESSSSYRLQKKHKKEKKKRRHKRRHSDSSGDSSDARSDGELTKKLTYGPQLPKTSASSSSSSFMKDSKASSSSSSATVGPQLLSIVPYLSDADEDENEEDENVEEMKDSALVPSKGKVLSSESKLLNNLSHVSSPIAEEDMEKSSEVGVGNEAKIAKLAEEKSSRIVEEGHAESEGIASKQKSSGVETHLDLKTDGRGTLTLQPSDKSKRTAKEVIDMFAEDFAVKEEKRSEDQDCIKNEKVSGRENELEKIVQDGKVKQASEWSHITAVGSPSASLKTSASSFSNTSNSSTSGALKTAPDIVKEKSKERKDAAKLLHIAYESDEEDQKVAEEEEKSKRQKEMKAEEDNLPQIKTSSSSLSPSETRKRKKEKKKHKHEDRDRKKAEEGRDVLPNIIGNNLGREIMAKVEETLDKEISDIVIHTVSQNSPATLSSYSKQLIDRKPLSSENSWSAQVEENPVKKHSRPGKETKEIPSNKDHLESLKKQEAQKQLVKPVNAKEEEKVSADGGVLTSESVKHEKEVNGENVDEDDDDIDFEDLDDLDRALEVALEKKKVELAKYEERERKVQKDLALATSGSEPVAENAQIEDSDQKAEVSQVLEEKVKAEVRDAAELALSKLEFLDISTENLSRLQVLFIELQTRLNDWSAGGLSTSYFQDQLGVAQTLLEQYEQSAVPNGWACQWDRGNNRYYYRNLTTNRIQWDYPDEDRGGKGSVEELNGEDGNSNVDGPKKDRKDEEEAKKSSGRKSEKTRERKNTDGAGSADDKESVRRKGGSSSSRHRKREERDKDRGSKHDKRREGSSSSHRYRRKRRRRREHSSSSESSEDEGEALGASKSSSITSTGSSSRRHHRHHHKGSKKKRKRRSEQRSRSPSVEIVACSNSREGSSKENEENEKSTPSVTVLDASPTNSSVVSTPNVEEDTTVSAKSAPPQSAECIDGEPLVKNGDIGGDVDGVAYHEDGDVDGVSLNADESKHGEKDAVEEGEIGEEEGSEKGEDKEEEKESEVEPVNTAVIYKPPQIVVPPQILAAARQPELYGVPQSAPALQAPQSSALQAAPSVGSGFTTAQGQSSQHSSEGPSETGEDSDKQGRKKKKEKKLATGPSLMMKKKHMSSMVQKWQKVKKEVEKEDRAKEMRQAAIRKKIEELK